MAPPFNWIFGGLVGDKLISSLSRTKIAPWDQFSTKDRNVEFQSKIKMLFESMHKCSIWFPLEILSFIDLKILKIGLEMTELAIAKRVPFGHNMRSKSHERTTTDFQMWDGNESVIFQIFRDVLWA